MTSEQIHQSLLKNAGFAMASTDRLKVAAKDVYGSDPNSYSYGSFGRSMALGKRVSELSRSMSSTIELASIVLDGEAISTESQEASDLFYRDYQFCHTVEAISAKEIVDSLREQAINISHDAAWYYYGEGTRELDGNKLAAAEMFEKALKLNAEHEPSAAALAPIYYGEKKYPKALTLYKQLIRMNSDLGEYHAGAGLCLLRIAESEKDKKQISLAKESVVEMKTALHYSSQLTEAIVGLQDAEALIKKASAR